MAAVYDMSDMAYFFPQGQGTTSSSSSPTCTPYHYFNSDQTTATTATSFDLSDFNLFDDGLALALPQASFGQPVDSASTAPPLMENSGSGEMERPWTGRIAFRMKSEVEILDDGFKWRKYGKKSVKNSPNPRNYYRCSTEGCSVKKRVERDREDPGYVITTYEGVHNHMSPGVVYYTTQDATSGQYLVAGCKILSGS
ncbi:probable WRKY transcription factor 24 [Typha latifolia]|uniref:probable WRKY transcription factor 24 n=1 Tax=Typha latifolia TaxID=4733 RepID=UPI003C2AF0D1